MLTELLREKDSELASLFKVVQDSKDMKRNHADEVRRKEEVVFGILLTHA
jgi:hypothetical protein